MKTDQPIQDRLLSAMTAKAPDRMDAVANLLAEQGDLEALQMILRSGLLSGHPQLRMELGIAIAPLIGNPAATALLKEWLEITDLDTPEKLSKVLHEASMGTIAESAPALLALGADPNAMNGADSGPTAVQRALSLNKINVFKLYVACLKERGQIPVYRIDEQGRPVTVFDHFASPELDNLSAVNALLEACDHDLPEPWRRDLGRAMLASIDKRAKPMLSPTDGRNTTDLLLIGECQFDDPADWLRLLAGGENFWTIPTQLAYSSQLLKFVPDLIPRMQSAGVDFDAILSKYQKGNTTCPLLFCAVGAANVTLIKILLELGADPARKIDIHDPRVKGVVQRDAYELAPPGSDTDRALRVWRTQQMVQEVGRQAARRRPSSSAN